MDTALGDQLVTNGLLTADELIEVRRRVDTVGGPVDTAIFEVRSFDAGSRTELKRLLAEHHGWPVASVALLNAPDYTAFTLLPEALAKNHGLLAMAISAQYLTIASSGIDAQTQSEIAFAIGRTPQMEYAFEVELYSALHQFAEHPLPARIARLLDRGPGYLADAPEHARVVALPAQAAPAPSVTESGQIRVITLAAPDDATLPDMPVFRPGQSLAPRAAPDREAVDAALQRVQVDKASADDLTLLVSAGGMGLNGLMRIFPGPLRLDRYTVDPRRVKPSAYSPVIDAIIRFGARAAPRLEGLLTDPSPELRYCALACFLGIRHPASQTAIAERLFDGDAAVRQMTYAVLTKRRTDPGFEKVVDLVRARLTSTVPSERRGAMQAASALHLSAVCERLIALLDGNAQTATQARRALVEICHQDFGLSAWQWRNWYQRFRDAPRVEWLLAGMGHEQQTVRAAAARELERLTFQNYGFSAAAPPQQRAAAIAKWRAWWQRSGQRTWGAYR
jgi:hypothetical protein